MKTSSNRDSLSTNPAAEGIKSIEFKPVARAALLGGDFRAVNFELLCQEGDRLQAGSAVMRDARRPAIQFSAPLAGTLDKIERGARRKLLSLQIELDAQAGKRSFALPTQRDRASLRALMLESGAWTALRTRPFGNIPDVDAEPAALFITAIDNAVLAPRPEPIIDAFAEEFRAALSVLAKIVDAPLYVCHARGYAPPVDETKGVSCVAFGNNPAAGLAGTHINALTPIGFGGRQVWHIDYQEVISLGHLLLSGSAWGERVISLGGDALLHPRLLRVVPGASIDELLADEIKPGASWIYSGTTMPGGEGNQGTSFLEMGQRQVCVTMQNSATRKSTGCGVVIPGDRLEAVAPPGIHAVPLLRALQLGDVDRARDLGALELVEEDLAPLSLACASGSDYGALLRDVLDQLEQAN